MGRVLNSCASRGVVQWPSGGKRFRGPAEGAALRWANLSRRGGSLATGRGSRAVGFSFLGFVLARLDFSSFSHQNPFASQTADQQQHAGREPDHISKTEIGGLMRWR